MTRQGDKAFFNKKKYIKESFNVITRAADPANLDFAEKQRARLFCVAAVNFWSPDVELAPSAVSCPLGRRLAPIAA
ncbi:hypothetical protein [Massilia sp. TWR1-2-2]|uniref:hypothetical protein n=1 Tax=Massilia sp. TWR1-2-2 TaxID=2804584 RepID=UPI003CF306A6